jgi:hypothetical protein
MIPAARESGRRHVARRARGYFLRNTLASGVVRKSPQSWVRVPAAVYSPAITDFNDGEGYGTCS